MAYFADSEGSPGLFQRAPESLPVSTPSLAISRAMEWVKAGLIYCQVPNGGTDKHGVCNRESNPEWDPYRSDCSGIVSWAWGLSPPGVTTAMLPPNQSDVAIQLGDISELQKGDALNKTGHVMLFDSWIVPGSRIRTIEEYDFGKPASVLEHDIVNNGSSLFVGDHEFFPIRYVNMQADPPSAGIGTYLAVGAGVGVAGYFLYKYFGK